MPRWLYFAVGLLVSVAYVSGLLYLDNSLLDFLRTADWNNKGDTLAGIFAPLAFFWLVIGFWMQSIELGLMRQQLKQEHESIRRVEQVQREGNEYQRRTGPPDMLVTLTESGDELLVIVRNLGGTAYDVRLTGAVIEDGRSGNLPRFEHGETIEHPLVRLRDGIFRVEYKQTPRAQTEQKVYNLLQKNSEFVLDEL